MNYIARLQSDLAAARAELAAKAETIQAFRVHLSGDKFAGFEPDGSRKDWISVTDVSTWLMSIVAAEGDGEPAS